MENLKELKFYISVYGKSVKDEEVRISPEKALTVEQAEEFIKQFKNKNVS